MRSIFSALFGRWHRPFAFNTPAACCKHRQIALLRGGDQVEAVGYLVPGKTKITWRFGSNVQEENTSTSANSSNWQMSPAHSRDTR